MDGHGIRDGGAQALAAAGETIGPWTVLRPLGEGGWARVDLARAADGAAPVALKRPLVPAAESLRRLEHEAQLTRLVRSPHVVQVVGYNLAPREPWLALEWVDGADLGQLIAQVRARRQLIPTEVVASVLLGMARGLRDAHEAVDPGSGADRTILHGDIKPSNVLLGRAGSVKLADFGAAWQVGWHPDLGGLGTLAYAAPERTRPGEAPTADVRSDLFSLGAVAFELCGLAPLFTGDSAELLQQHIEAGAYLSARLASLPPHVQPGLRRLIRQLVQPQPARRPPSAAAVVGELEALAARLELGDHLAGYLAPYLEVRWVGQGTGHLTGELRPGAQGAGGAPLVRRPLTGPLPLVVGGGERPRAASVQGTLSTQRREARVTRLQVGALAATAALGLALGAWVALPHTVTVETEPAGAFVSMQPGCDGQVISLQRAPLSFRVRGPWPLCLHVEREGYVPEIVRIPAPAPLARSAQAQVQLAQEGCVSISSRPTQLPIYIDNRLRGTTGVGETLICRLAPDVPYVVQLEYRGVRWDVREVTVAPGGVEGVSQDFGFEVTAPTTALQRCQRYHGEREWERAVELCRVAVVESQDYRERIEALVLQADARRELGAAPEGCELLYHALGLAVEQRDLPSEERIEDLRQAQGCQDPPDRDASEGTPAQAPGGPGEEAP